LAYISFNHDNRLLFGKPINFMSIHLLQRLLCLILSFALAGCGTIQGPSDGGAGGLVAANSLAQKLFAAPADPRSGVVQIEAGGSLNEDAGGRPLSVVVRMYYLRDANSFLRASYELLASTEKAREALGADMLDTKEVVMVPGSRYENNEHLKGDARFLGIVVLFRSPDPSHWRYVFAASDINSDGLVLGLHRCAVTVNSGKPVGESLGVATREGVNKRCR
jgi:type VI secretion system protein VasD